MGRHTGSSHVRSRLKTRVRKRPIGAVNARMTARNTAICSQPLDVMSELLRAQQCVCQIHEQSDRHEKTDRIIQSHGAYSSRSHAATYAAATRKNRTVMTTKSASMVAPSDESLRRM